MRAAFAGRVAALLLAFAALAARAPAQMISPGPLSRLHSKLEGSTRCLECHELRGGPSSSKCLKCHETLRARIEAGKGLHASSDHRDCRRCHVEHKGAELELVVWGKAGREGFDHRRTGHRLSGEHATLACGRCHKTRSYLGLPTACASCHEDAHRGQFEGRACSSCHDERAWGSARSFDHGRTRYALAGRHAAVACDKCHPAKPDPVRADQGYRVFRGVATDCASCHRDTHQARFGSACGSCHSTTGWRDVRRASFDHDRTRYRLAGRHAAVSCEKCHPPGRPLRVKHARCDDCHRDVHARAASDTRGCETCHGLEGFRPSRFATLEHAKTEYPLAGAHLAVACNDCHCGSHGRTSSVQGAVRTVPLRLSGRRCLDCHADPHGSPKARAAAAPAGCETCHRADSWRTVSYRHELAGYPLMGRHANVACTACHRPAGDGLPPSQRTPAAVGPVSLGTPLPFTGAPRACADCHRDPHAGQLADATGKTACENCHGSERFAGTTFDHDRSASYRLTGAHARIACAACHKTEERGGVKVVRYRPLPKTCAGCHRGRRVADSLLRVVLRRHSRFRWRWRPALADGPLGAILREQAPDGAALNQLLFDFDRSNPITLTGAADSRRTR